MAGCAACLGAARKLCLPIPAIQPQPGKELLKVFLMTCRKGLCRFCRIHSTNLDTCIAQLPCLVGVHARSVGEQWGLRRPRSVICDSACREASLFELLHVRSVRGLISAGYLSRQSFDGACGWSAALEKRCSLKREAWQCRMVLHATLLFSVMF